MGQSSHNEVVLFHLGDLPTQPPLPPGWGNTLIIHREGFKQEGEEPSRGLLMKLISNSMSILMREAGLGRRGGTEPSDGGEDLKIYTAGSSVITNMADQLRAGAAGPLL